MLFITLIEPKNNQTKLVSFSLFFFFLLFSYFKIWITRPHITLAIPQLTYFYKKVLTINNNIIIQQIYLLVGNWSNPITWQNIPWLKLGDIRGYASWDIPQFSNLTSNMENSVFKMIWDEKLCYRRKMFLLFIKSFQRTLTNHKQ